MTNTTAIWGHVIDGKSRRGEAGVLQKYDPATGT